MRLVPRADPLDRDDLFPGDAPERLGAGALRLAVDDYRAGATLLEPAAEAAAGEAKGVPQDVEQEALLVARDGHRPSVDCEIDVAHRPVFGISRSRSGRTGSR